MYQQTESQQINEIGSNSGLVINAPQPIWGDVGAASQSKSDYQLPELFITDAVETKEISSEKVFDLDLMLAQELLSDLTLRPQYRS